MKLRTIIARALLLACAVLVLTSCSTARVVYNQAPSLMYWWIDGYADLNDAQSPRVRQEIDAFLAWHRSTELPAYAARLAKWQAMATQDITATQVCSEFEAVRTSFQRLTERSLEPMAWLALQLTPEQLQHLQRHQEKGHQTFEKEFLRGSPEERLNNRMDKAAGRYETLYGPLTESQKALFGARLQQSPFDPERTQAERKQRQAALLQTILEMQAAHGRPQPRPAVSGSSPANANGGRATGGSAPAVPAEAVAFLRTWSQRLFQSSTPAYAGYTERMVRHGCAQFADLHNSTSAGQRAHAVQVLKGYEDDLRALAAQGS